MVTALPAEQSNHSDTRNGSNMLNKEQKSQSYCIYVMGS